MTVHPPTARLPQRQPGHGRRQALRRLSGPALAGLAGMAVLGPTLAGCAATRPAPMPEPRSMPDPRAGGRLDTVERFASRHTTPRRVDVWLPPGYERGTQRHAVLYLHDGQNLFDPALAFGGEPWGLDRHLAALMQAGAVRPTIAVGLWNTATRWRDYVPAPALRGLDPQWARRITADGTEDSRTPLSDGYLRFIVDELKPWVDARYRTHPGRDDTLLMGSSMGGLVSLYGLISHPRTFGAAAGLSTHWPVSTNHPLQDRLGTAGVDAIAQHHLDFVARALPPAGAHRIYADHGTEGLDAWYAPYQARLERILAARGYRQGVDCLTRVHPGADHRERDWRQRLAEPLRFLLGARPAT